MAISTMIPTAFASDERPDAYAEWDEDSTFTTTGTAVARVVDHYMNMDSEKVEELTVDIYTEETEDLLELVITVTETNVDTGIFEGTVFFSETDETSAPRLQVKDGDIVSVEYVYSQVPGSDKREDMIAVGQEKTIQNFQKELKIDNVDKVDPDDYFAHDMPNSLSEEKIIWINDSYPSTGTGVVRMTDPDMNLDPKAVDNFDVDVWSDSDLAGIDLTMTETDVSTGIFEGTVFFSTSDESSGHRLRVAEGETITAKHIDLGIIDTALIQGIHSPDNIDDRITLDKTNYMWTDKVHITIDAPEHNLDSNKVEEIGSSEQYPVKVATRHFDLDNYRLVETGVDTGIFTGEITLTGFKHDIADASSIGDGPTNGLLLAADEDGISVSFEHTEDQTAINSAGIQSGGSMAGVSSMSSPYQQMKDGVLPEHVKCDDDYDKIYKPSNSATCVKPSSTDKLIQRGWSMDLIV